MDNSISSKMDNSLSSKMDNSLSSKMDKQPNSSVTVGGEAIHNKLYDKWSLWGHLPHDIDWTLNSYKQITTLETVEQTIALYETLPERMINNCMLFLMRKGINPMWEDPKNHKGGCFSYKINNKNVASVWKNLSYTLVGETLTEDKHIRANINGITISPKKNFCIIKIWLATCEYQNPKTIGEIAGGITAQGCLFKKHM
jgi:hypothetical protein